MDTIDPFFPFRPVQIGIVYVDLFELIVRGRGIVGHVGIR